MFLMVFSARRGRNSYASFVLNQYIYAFMQFAKYPIWIEPLADGHAGTLRTLEVMRWLVRKDSRNPFVRTKTTNFIEQQSSHSPVAALFLFARDKIRYVPDPPNLEKVSDFEHTTASREGDCDDKVVWLGTALLSIGVPVRFVVQSYDGGSWDHVYLEFYDWQAWGWTALDPTADGHTGLVADVGWRQPLPQRGREMVYEV